MYLRTPISLNYVQYVVGRVKESATREWSDDVQAWLTSRIVRGIERGKYFSISPLLQPVRAEKRDIHQERKHNENGHIRPIDAAYSTVLSTCFPSS